MKKPDMFDQLNKLAEISLKIANAVDRGREKNDNLIIEELGLGYLALSGYLRTGVKAIVDIQSAYSNRVSEAELARIGEGAARDFLEDVFGDRDIDSINEKDKARIREFVQGIIKEWDERN